MHIFESIAAVCTKTLFTVRSRGQDMYNQVFDRPLVMLIGSRDPNRQGSPQLIDPQMNFAALVTTIGWIFASLGTVQGCKAHHAVDGFPLAARPQHMPEAIDNIAVRYAWTTWPANFGGLGQMLLAQFPKLARHAILLLHFCAMFCHGDVTFELDS